VDNRAELWKAFRRVSENDLENLEAEGLEGRLLFTAGRSPKTGFGGKLESFAPGSKGLRPICSTWNIGNVFETLFHVEHPRFPAMRHFEQGYRDPKQNFMPGRTYKGDRMTSSRLSFHPRFVVALGVLCGTGCLLAGASTLADAKGTTAPCVGIGPLVSKCVQVAQ
jgi:hypothetical protein